MKSSNFRISGLAVLIAIAVACGPSPEELKKQEQARQDSLRKVQEQARLKMEAEEAAAAAQSATEANKEEKTPAPAAEAEPSKQPAPEVIKYDANGTLTLQVEAWRTQRAAEKAVDRWKRRGLENAYVVVKENSETGEVWYRVRIGKFRSAKWAKKQAERLKNEFNADTWVDNAGDEVRVY